VRLCAWVLHWHALKAITGHAQNSPRSILYVS
jgi:hypothetical protein